MERSEAFGEAIVFLEHFEGLADPRQRGKVLYPVDEVLLLCLLAVLAGAETVADIARFGDKKLALLRRFPAFTHGTPSHDQLGTILASLDGEQFQQCFVAWVATITGAPAEVIAIDSLPRTPIRGQEPAPQLPEEGCQRAGAHGRRLRRPPAAGARPGQGHRQVQRDRGDPAPARHAGHRRCGRHHRCHGMPARHRGQDPRQEGRLHPRPQELAPAKAGGNQTSLREEVALFVAEQKANGFQHTAMTRHQSVDGDHGRIETRTTTVIHDVEWLQTHHK